MTDKTIPFYNIILRCDYYRHQTVVLPKGFFIVPYQCGFEKEWAKLEYAIGDFVSLAEAENYFISTYLQNRDLFENILFLVNEENAVVGSCIAWTDRHGDVAVSSLHWLVVAEEYQGMGLGKALCVAVMNIFEKRGGIPVYIHTQPWSRKAIFLYLSLGFRLQKKDTFAHYENEYDKAMSALKRIVTEKQFEVLSALSEN